MSPNPVDHPELYNVLVLVGQASPGVFKWSSPPARDEGWDLQQPKGDSGGETINNGEKLVECEGEFTLWKDPSDDDEPDHYLGWDSWRLLLQVAKDAAKGLDAYHPQLAEIGITSVVPKKIGTVHPNGDGSATVKVTFIEFRPPQKKSGGKANGSKSGGGKKGANGADGPDPNQDLKDEIKKKTEEYKNL